MREIDAQQPVSDAPITVFAKHHVLPGRKEVFQEWVRGIAEASSRYAGYIGTEVVKPSETEDDHYVVLFRFDTKSHLETWIRSEDRQTWIERVGEFSEQVPTLDYHSLEFWFTPSQDAGRAPAKHKMATVTLAVIWPLVHFVPPLVANTVPAPHLAVEFISVATIVLLMTYAVMPTVTRLLEPWLFARK